ncbi:hypothetical protein NQ317_009849 [Molorchus minor]|uniref:Uncharacterized protein n=1 Tax=Molorchus minor TaxID=1323400 RepID=A0ABQ9K4Z8_9CUCU|nr:hypothetical protein NQ317_009849 [Molorchus minor]
MSACQEEFNNVTLSHLSKINMIFRMALGFQNSPTSDGEGAERHEGSHAEMTAKNFLGGGSGESIGGGQGSQPRWRRTAFTHAQLAYL